MPKPVGDITWTATRFHRLDDSSDSAFSDQSTNTAWSDDAGSAGNVVNYANNPAGSVAGSYDKTGLSAGAPTSETDGTSSLPPDQVTLAGSGFVFNNTLGSALPPLKTKSLPRSII